MALKDLRRDARRKRRELEEAAEERDRLRASLQSARGTIAALESQLRALRRTRGRQSPTVEYCSTLVQSARRAQIWRDVRAGCRCQSLHAPGARPSLPLGVLVCGTQW